MTLVLLLVAGCRERRPGAQEQPSESPGTAAVVSDMTDDAARWADSVCAALTLRQKVAQLFLPALFASDDLWTLRRVREYADSCIGGIVLLKGDTRGASVLADSLSAWSRVMPFVAIDAEWGLAMRLADAPGFPANGTISPEADEQLMYDYGRELARECRLIGIDMVLGPVVDVAVPGGLMRRRSFGEDPRRVADLALAYARGLEDGGVLSVAKHFPGHGSVSADSHVRKGVIERSLHEMDSIDLYPFRRWVEQRLSGVMAGHLAVPSIDPDMRPAAVSPTVITDLLRDDLGFSGLVLTDALNMKGAEGYGAADAVMAGADIVVAPASTFREVESVVRAVESGAIAEADIDTHVRRILFYKYLAGASGLRAGLRRDSVPGSSGFREAEEISGRLVSGD
ncbi:MAG: hypothetical protein K2L57_05385 [Muribaculaceae bacterium]|nr:hypothetical protein [Muribaculaceae bacterium]